jgi:hypothetical protein
MKRKGNDGAPTVAKKAKHNNKTMNITMLPRELMIEIFTYIPYRKLIRNIALVNHTCHDIILGDGNVTLFWKQVCRHQSIEFNVDTMVAESFVTKYQIPNLHIVTCDQYQNNIKAAKLIEPFVTTLSFAQSYKYDDEGEESLIDHYYLYIERHIFPMMESLDIIMSCETVQKYFGTDLSRFKQLTLFQQDSESKPDFKFGSLECVTLSKCGDFDRHILKQNLNTLHSVTLVSVDNQSLDVIEMLAPTISTLAIRMTEGVLSKQIFSYLKELKINASGQQIMQFFSVTHPLLRKVHLRSYSKWDEFGDITLAQQSSIRYITSYVPNKLINAFLKVVNQTAIVLIELNQPRATKHDSSIDLSPFSNLKQLTVDIDLRNCCRNDTVPESENYNIEPELPVFHYLWYLSVHTLDEYMLLEVMKLPCLNTLHVTNLSTSYARLTNLLRYEPSSNIKNYSIESMEETNLNYETISIFPPLEYLNIGPLKMLDATNCEKWLYFVISTVDVDEVNYSALKHIVKDLLAEYFISDSVTPLNLLLTLIIQQLQNTLNTVIEKDSQESEQEKKVILDRFETMFDEKQLKESYRTHPAMKYLIGKARQYI